MSGSSSSSSSSSSKSSNSSSSGGSEGSSPWSGQSGVVLDPIRPMSSLSDEESGSQHFDTPPVSVTWEDLRLEVTLKDGSLRTILDGVTGFAAAGTATCLMGPSGAGKTSLLNAISSRVGGSSAVSLTGTVRLNGEVSDADDFRAVASYVVQDDLLLGELSAYESALFAARMTLGGVPDAQRKEKVQSVLEELNIDHVQHTAVGVAGIKRGLSGGERKRAMIATSLVGDISVIALDEPTSGYVGVVVW